MQHRSFMGLLVMALAFATVAAPGELRGQEPALAQESATPQGPALPQIDQAKLMAYAQAYVAISAVRDEIQALMAESGNKTPEALVELRERLKEEVATVVQEHGLSEEEYERITFVVSADEAQRTAFNEILATLQSGEQ